MFFFLSKNVKDTGYRNQYARKTYRRNQDAHRQCLIIPQGEWVEDKIDDDKENSKNLILTNSPSSELTKLALPISSELDNTLFLFIGSQWESRVTDHKEGRRGPVCRVHKRVRSNSKADVKSRLQPSLLFRSCRHTVQDDTFDIRDFFFCLGNHLASVIGLQEL